MFRKTQYVYSVYCIHQQQGPVSHTHTHTHRKDHTQQLDLNNTCQVATPKKASKNGCRTISCKQLSDSSCPEIFSARCEQKKNNSRNDSAKVVWINRHVTALVLKKGGLGLWAMSIDSKQRPHRSQSSTSNVQIFPQKMVVNKRTCIHTISVYYKHTSTTTIHSPQVSGKFN